MKSVFEVLRAVGSSLENRILFLRKISGSLYTGTEKLKWDFHLWRCKT